MLIGTFRARLEHEKAPRTCANFIGLATGRRPWIRVTTGEVMRNKPYYNGLTFHRLVHDFMIQGGSSDGLGSSGPGYVIQDEYEGSLRHSGRYVLSMAKSTLPSTGSSQFFITLDAAPFLDDKHSVFGEIISGREVIDGFTNAATYPTSNERLLTPIVMDSVVISGPGLEGFDIDSPSLRLPVVSDTVMVPSRDGIANTFSLTFARGFQTEHLVYSSEDLQSWTYEQHIRSRDAAAAVTYIMEASSPRFFVRSPKVDYGLLPNPPTNLLPAGKQLVLSDRAGNTLTLLPNGSGGGTWTHSNGGSGTLSGVATADYANSTGVSAHTSSTGHLFPLAEVTANLSPPAGPAGWKKLSFVLSLHSPTTGWIEGTATLDNNSIVQVLQSFTLSP